MSALIWTYTLLWWLGTVIMEVQGMAHCTPDCDRCEFWLTAEARLTMMQKHDKGLVVAKHGKLYPYDFVGRADKELDMDDVVSANGWHIPKVLNLFNGSLPGPTLVMYEGQEVVVHVQNNLLSESITVHFHGLWQRGTPWMDGVAFITQCPIMAGQSFTHRFWAGQQGTYWYHSHIGLQIPTGMYGAFIIRERPKNGQSTTVNKERKTCVCEKNDEEPRPKADREAPLNFGGHSRSYTSPHTDQSLNNDWSRSHNKQSNECRELNLGEYETHQEFVMTVASYNHEWDAITDFLHMYQGIYFNNLTLVPSQRAYDGAYYSAQKFNSVLINGRGRYLNPETKLRSQSPLYTFKARRNKWIRFRAIGVETQIPFEISIDHHILYVVAMDGMKIENVAVDSVILGPGERVDFYILTRMEADNYWIRAMPLVQNQESNHGEAILSYDGAGDHLPRPRSKRCTYDKPCYVLNCPMKMFPKESHKRCLHTSDVKNREVSKLNKVDRQIFLNFMLHPRWSRLNSINGRAFRMPTVAAMAQPNETPAECKERSCRNYQKGPDPGDDRPSPCQCFHTLHIRYGETVEIVLSNLGVWNRALHPIHLHGHHFEVIKIAHGKTNERTGQLIGDNEDLKCIGVDRDARIGCTDPAWRNNSWNSHIPGSNTHNPPLKDTIFVPSGGYVVIRFKADNPGFWFMHCHTSAHYVTGMALVVKEAVDEIPDPPKNFPHCHNFT